MGIDLSEAQPRCDECGAWADWCDKAQMNLCPMCSEYYNDKNSAEADDDENATDPE